MVVGHDSGWRRRVVDVTVLLAVPAVLLGLFALSPATRRALAFSTRDPTVVTAFTMHFVHLTTDHLVGNLLAYLAVVPFTYYVAVRSGRRASFFGAFVLVLGVLPFVLSALDLTVARPHVTLGFSDLDMAFLGLFPLATCSSLVRRYPGLFDREYAFAPFFGGVAVVAFLALPASRVRLGLTGVATLLAVAFGHGYVRAVRRAWARPVAREDVGLLAVGLVVFALCLVAAFPPRPAVGPTVTNVRAHALGYGFGLVVWVVAFPALDAVRWSGEAVDDRPASPA